MCWREVRAASVIRGTTDLVGVDSPVTVMCGDQQSALCGQAATAPGECKNTYGTGCCLLMNTGDQAVESRNGLLTTIAWGIDGKVQYALEGSVFVAGAVIAWLRGERQIGKTGTDSAVLAATGQATGGGYPVAALVGVG